MGNPASFSLNNFKIIFRIYRRDLKMAMGQAYSQICALWKKEQIKIPSDLLHEICDTHTYTQRFAVSVEHMLSEIQSRSDGPQQTSCIFANQKEIERIILNWLHLMAPNSTLVNREYLLFYQMLSMISSSLKLYKSSYSPVLCSWLQDNLTFQFPSAPHTK